MKKEEIILEVYRLCEEIHKLGFYPIVRFSFKWAGLQISVYDLNEDSSLNENVLNVECFIEGEYKSTFEIKPIEQLTEFINHHKKVA